MDLPNQDHVKSPNDYDDSTTMRVGNGTPSFRTLIEVHQNMVCAISYAMLRDKGLSQDASQQAFLALWQKLPSIRDHRAIPGWLRTTTRHICSKMARKNGVLCESPDDDSVATFTTPFEELSQKEHDTLVRRALRELPSEICEVILLYYQETQSVEAVARQLGVSNAAVRQRLSRGRKMLAHRLTPTFIQHIAADRPTKGFAAAIVALVSAWPERVAQAQPVGQFRVWLRPSSWGIIHGSVLVLLVVAASGYAVVRHKNGASFSAHSLAAAKVAPNGAATQVRRVKQLPTKNLPAGTIPVDGFVLDQSSEPIAKATVTIDGETVVSDDTGYFLFPSMKVGQHSLFASEGLRRTAFSFAARSSRSPLMVTLEPATVLEIRVIDGRTGKPVPQAVVSNAHGKIHDPSNDGRATTGGDGIARLVVRGSLQGISVTKPGFAEGAYSDQVPRGGVHKISIVLRPGCEVTGRIVDEHQRPVENLAVTLRGTFDDEKSRGRTVASMADGAFRFAGIPEGSYVLALSDTTAKSIQRDWTCTPPLAIDVGTVVAETRNVISGTVVDDQGKAVPLATIYASGDGGLNQTQADSTGRFSVPGIPGGPTMISAEAYPLAAAPISVKGGDSSVGLIVQERSIRGRVIDAQGLPVEGTVVTAVAQRFGAPRTDLTDESGTFELLGLAGQDYFLTLTKEPVFGHIAKFLGRETTAKPGDHAVVIQKKPGISVHGAILARDGTPVTNCRISADSARSKGLPDAGQHYPTSQFTINDLAAGDTIVKVRCPGYANTRLERNLSSPVNDLGSIVVDKAQTLRGRVLNSLGKPIPAAEVRVVVKTKALPNPLAAEKTSAISEVDGSFELSDLGVSGTLVATHPAWGRSPEVAFGGANSLVEIVIPVPVSVQLRLVAGRRPLSNFSLIIDRHTARTDDKGLCQLALPSGEHNIFANSGMMSLPQKIAHVLIPANNSAAKSVLTVDVGIAGALAVTVPETLAKGRVVLVPGATGELSDQPGKMIGARTQDVQNAATPKQRDQLGVPSLPADIRFAAWFPIVPPGDYRICVLREKPQNARRDFVPVTADDCKPIVISENVQILKF